MLNATKLLGGLLIIVGAIFSLTGYGMVLGIPMILIGALMIAGRRRMRKAANAVRSGEDEDDP